MFCNYLRKGGKQCQAHQINGSEFCFRHTDKELALVVSSRGGLNRRLQGNFGNQVQLESPEDIKLFLGQVINSVWTGQVPVQVGTSMGFLARCWLDANEAANFESRIKELEKRVERDEFTGKN